MIFTGFLPQQCVYFVVARAITRTSTESSWRMMQYALVMFSPAVPGWLLLHWRFSEIKKWDPKSVADFGFPKNVDAWARLAARFMRRSSSVTLVDMEAGVLHPGWNQVLCMPQYAPCIPHKNSGYGFSHSFSFPFWPVNQTNLFSLSPNASFSFQPKPLLNVSHSSLHAANVSEERLVWLLLWPFSCRWCRQVKVCTVGVIQTLSHWGHSLSDCGWALFSQGHRISGSEAWACASVSWSQRDSICMYLRCVGSMPSKNLTEMLLTSSIWFGQHGSAWFCSRPTAEDVHSLDSKP